MPRPAAPDAGLRQPARSHFPETTLEQGSALTLIDSADIYRRQAVSDGAGGTSMEWHIVEAGLPARIDRIGGAGEAELIGGQITESPSHIVRLPSGSAVTEADRVHIEGVEWSVVGFLRRTDDVTMELAVKEAGA